MNVSNTCAAASDRGWRPALENKVSEHNSNGPAGGFRLSRSGAAEDADARLWRRGPTRKGFRGWADILWRRRWTTLATFLAALVIGLVWIGGQDEEHKASLALQARIGGASGGPATPSDVSAVITQLGDSKLIENVARRMRLYRTAQGSTVADRTVAAARQIADSLEAKPGAEPGRIELTYRHRNGGHAADLLNVLGEVYVAERGAIAPGAGDVRNSATTPAEELRSARRAMSEFLRLNPVSRIEPQKRQNEDRIRELEGEIGKIDQALATVGAGEAGRTLRSRREDFEGMLERHRTRISALDGMGLRRRQLESRVQEAQRVVAGGPGELPTANAPIAPTTPSQIHVEVVAKAIVDGVAVGSARIWLLALALLAALLAAAATSRWVDNRGRGADNTDDLSNAAGAPVLVISEDERT